VSGWPYLFALISRVLLHDGYNRRTAVITLDMPQFLPLFHLLHHVRPVGPPPGPALELLYPLLLRLAERGFVFCGKKFEEGIN
jgi:hypothetical protein